MSDANISGLIEVPLRVFGMAYFFDEYEKPMKEFLNRTMNREKDGTSSQVQALVKHFAAMAETIVTKLGARPFHVRGPLNSAALDAVFATLLKAKGKLPDDLGERYTDESFG